MGQFVLLGCTQQILQRRLTQHGIDCTLNTHPYTPDGAVDGRVLAGVARACEVVAERGVVERAAQGSYHIGHTDVGCRPRQGIPPVLAALTVDKSGPSQDRQILCDIVRGHTLGLSDLGDRCTLAT